MLCNHCTTKMDMTREVEDNTHGIVTLRDYLCPRCGSTASTRQPKRQPETVLHSSEPLAATDARETAQMEHQARGIGEFYAKGGRHVR